MNDNQLIPRSVIFSNHEKDKPTISPNSEQIAFLADVGGVMNIFLAPKDDLAKSKQLSNEKRNISRYFWAFDNKHIIYLQDHKGDENHHIYAINIQTLKVRDLTPFNKTKAKILQCNEKFPEHIIIGLNKDGKSLHDPYKLNIATGELVQLEENPGFLDYIVDNNYEIRFGAKMEKDGSISIAALKNEHQQDNKPINIPFEDSSTTRILGFNKTNDAIYWLDSRNRNTNALTIQNLKDPKSQQILGSSERADIDDIIIHPTTYAIQGWAANYLKPEWHFIDKEMQDHYQVLEQFAKKEGVEAIPYITSRSLLDNYWIVSFLSDSNPTAFYLYDTKAKTLNFLFITNQQLAKYKLQPMQVVEIPARDGLTLISYLTTPPSQYRAPYPTVLLVHGGPRARDEWRMNVLHQWLANRGYAVLSVNYRSSTGFGKNFINAGNLEWAAKMHEDLLDAVKYVVAQGITDANKVAIVGGSYGGYATLVGLTFTPEVFACGVDIVGPSNLLTLVQSVPSYWKPALALFRQMLGDYDYSTEEGQEMLKQRSPLFKVKNIVKPLLIQHGTHDPRVKVTESKQIVEAMQHNHIPVIYMEFTNEGHGFLQPENKRAAFAATESFLHKYLGGTLEAPTKEDYSTPTLLLEGNIEELPEANFPVRANKAAN